MPLAQVITLLALAEKYGPTVFAVIKALTDKKDATVADVELAYAQLRPYESFGIPNIVPVPQTEAGKV